jgi:small subunit ribosomal protein S2
MTTNESGATTPATTPFGQQSGQEVTIKSLLEAGAHFGHQTSRWNPKMFQYIFGEKNGVHIINLDLTFKLWLRARKYIVDTLARGGNILFVGTKPQARDILAAEALRCSAPYINKRWLGGALTNFETIKRSIERMKRLEDYLAESEKPDSKIKIQKKEKVMIGKDLVKLSSTIGGIRNMKRAPDAVFIVDIQKEAIAVAEARRLRIPVIALVDTNVNPEVVDFPIPSNDDATKTLQLFLACAADAVLEGKALFDSRAQRASQQQSEAAAARAQQQAQPRA